MWSVPHTPSSGLCYTGARNEQQCKVLAFNEKECHVPLARLRPHASPMRLIALGISGLAILACAGCGSPVARASTPPPTHMSTSSPVSTVWPTVPSPPDCTALTPGPGSLATFPLPPGTVSHGPNGAAGAGFWIECTPSTSQQAIAAFLNTALPQAGWRQWNPQSDDARGCGTQPNDYWKWTKGGSAVGYRFTVYALPQWELVFCDLAYGH